MTSCQSSFQGDSQDRAVHNAMLLKVAHEYPLLSTRFRLLSSCCSQFRRHHSDHLTAKECSGLIHRLILQRMSPMHRRSCALNSVHVTPNRLAVDGPLLSSSNSNYRSPVGSASRLCKDHHWRSPKVKANRSMILVFGEYGAEGKCLAPIRSKALLNSGASSERVQLKLLFGPILD